MVGFKKIKMRSIKDFFRGFREGFKGFAFKVTDAINFVLLFFVYFIGVGITSIIAKIFGKHFLDLKFKDKKSYWVKRKLESRAIERYYKQF